MNIVPINNRPWTTLLNHLNISDFILQFYVFTHFYWSYFPLRREKVAKFKYVKFMHKLFVLWVELATTGTILSVVRGVTRIWNLCKRLILGSNWQSTKRVFRSLPTAMYWIKTLKEWSKSTTNTVWERRAWMKTNKYKWFPIHIMCEVCICSNLTLYLICSKEYTRKIATISWNFTSLSSSLFLTYIDAGRLYEAPEFISIFCGIHLAQTLVFCAMLCRPLFVLL